METSNEIFMFFMSNHSNSCKQVLDKLSYIAPHFNTKVINIDNPEIREIVLNATEYQITTVPAVLLIHLKENSIQKFEGVEVLNLLNKGVEMVQQKLAQQAEMQSSQEETQRGKTPLNKIIQKEYYESEDSINTEDLIEEEDEDEDLPPRRRKIGKTTIFPDKQFAPTDDDGMISNNKFLPPKGEGHSDMARSSLSEVSSDSRDRAMMDRNMNYPPRVDMERSSVQEDDDVPVKSNLKKRGPGRPSKSSIKNKVKFVDEDLQNADEKPRGMSMDEILAPEQGGATNKARDERSMSIKTNAEALMAARDQIIQEEEGNRKVKIRM